MLKKLTSFIGGLKSQSAVEYLTTYGWAIVIIGIVLAALYNLGVFNPGSFVSTQCVFPAEFGCLSAVLYSINSTIFFNLQNGQTSNINVTAIGCNNQGTISNMQSPLNPPSNQITLGIGGNYTFNALCYSNSTALSISPGTIFKGYLIVNYTNLATNFPHTVVATIAAKAV